MIIDPVILFREGLRRILQEAEFPPIWCSDRPPEAALPGLAPDDTLLLIVGGEIEAALRSVTDVKHLYPSCRVVLLFDGPASPHSLDALGSGIDSVVSRHSSCRALISTLNLAVDGATVLPAELIARLRDLREAPRPVPVSPEPTSAPQPSRCNNVAGERQAFGLSERELGVLELLREGLSNKEIARDLLISDATVKVHVKAILRKSRLRNRTQVAMWASRLGVGHAAPPAVVQPAPTVDATGSASAASEWTEEAVDGEAVPALVSALPGALAPIRLERFG